MISERVKTMIKSGTKRRRKPSQEFLPAATQSVECYSSVPSEDAWRVPPLCALGFGFRVSVSRFIIWKVEQWIFQYFYLTPGSFRRSPNSLS